MLVSAPAVVTRECAAARIDGVKARAAVPEVEPAELLRVPAPKGKGEDCC
jgi:hypothetical protein